MDVPWLVCQLHPPFLSSELLAMVKKIKCIYPVGTILVKGAVTEGAGSLQDLALLHLVKK